MDASSFLRSVDPSIFRNAHTFDDVSIDVQQQ